MPNIYDQHRAAFSQVSAFVILHNGERVATIAFKFPRDGASRLYAYVHYIGLTMARGFAGGGGYDKRSASASASAAARNIPDTRLPGGRPKHWTPEKADNAQAFLHALAHGDDGHGWEENLRKAGFTVLQAV